MRVTREVVERTAELAHVGLTDGEINEMVAELSDVLEHVAKLQQVDVSTVLPTTHAVPLNSVMRDDEVAPSWPQEAILANAPHRHGDFFEVPAVLD